MPEISFPLGALLAAGAGAADRPDKRGIPEAQVERLRELATRYGQPNPFKPFDLVTPRADAMLKGAGDVHIVLEVVDRITPSFRRGDCCSEKPFDMRVGWLDRDGDVVMSWVESVSMEPWWPPTATSADAAPHPTAPAEAGFGAAA